MTTDATPGDAAAPSGEVSAPLEMAAPLPAPEVPGDAPVLADVYPSLSSGALHLARLTELPDGILLQAEGVLMTESDLERDLSQAPAALREELRKNAFFIVEQTVTGDLLLTAARKSSTGGALSDELMVQSYFEELVGAMTVDDAEISAFYEANREMIGGAELESVRTAIQQHLLQEKQQEMVETHIRELGREMPIAVSSAWIEEQAVLATDNPIDQARASGVPTFASFGADSCQPCQMMKPFREAVAEKYGERLNVVYVHVNKDQILSSRYGVRGIPHVIFFDDAGREVHVQSGFMTQEQIEEWIGKIGVEM